jgi:NAD-dependent dihydropyrimidine dehydrogenase PreA subunit
MVRFMFNAVKLERKVYETMPKVVYDYGKCVGVGSCIEVCPMEVLELSGNGRWCKPVDEKVENKKAVKEFHEKVEGEEHGRVNVVIENEMPECIACRVCEAQCPHEAIKIVE